MGKERGFEVQSYLPCDPHLAGNASMFEIEIRASFHVLFDVAMTILNGCSIS